MKAEDLRSHLSRRNIKWKERKVQYGTQFRCPDGEIFMVFDTGTFRAQGAETPLSAELKAWEESNSFPRGEAVAAAAVPDAVRADQPVFIVYGHDGASRDALELLLRRMGLEPIILQNVPAAGDTIIEKLEHYLGEHRNVGFACVLLTPDDQGHKAGFPEETKYRARQNVVLELGMVLMSLGRRRVAILHKESVELPSDIAGLIYIPFKERPDEVRAKLFQELRNAGYNPKADAL